MGDLSKDIEGQQESIPLYPQLTQQPQELQQPDYDEADGNLTQEDLDRIWKPIFEDYAHTQNVCTTGCCAPQLRMPVRHLRELLMRISKSEDEVDGAVQFLQASKPTQRRVQMLQFASAPRLSRRVIDLVSTKADLDGDGFVHYQEFCDVILIRHKDDIEMDHLGLSQRIVNNAVKSVTPASYDEYYTCCPPPLFIILASLIEVAFYVYYCVQLREFSFTGPTPLHSPLIYDPHRRYEAWRFLSYALLHKGFIHIANNLVFQLVIGIPLEMAHGWWRVALVYLLGACVGCFFHSFVDLGTYLLGASGGVYALIGAHSANVIINWKEMRFGILRAVLLGLYIAFDIAWALYQRYGGVETQVGYLAHLGGFVGGLLLGVVVLRNFRVYKFERVLFYVCLVLFILFFLIGVVVNVTNAACSFGCQSDMTPLPDYIEKLLNRYNRG